MTRRVVYPCFWRRDFSPKLDAPGGPWHLEQASWTEPGGPDRASVVCQPSPAPLSTWLDLLRCPVEVLDGQGLPVWWGYVSAVEVENQAGRARFGLDGLYTRARIDYRYAEGAPALHAWALDSALAEQYGEKETYADLGVIEHEQRALNAASSRLARGAQLEQNWRPASAGAGQVRLELRGWWHTLGWRMRLWQGEGINAYDPEPVEEGNVGFSSTAVRAMQTFDGPPVEPPWVVSRARVSLRKVGAPADDLHIGIYADEGGLPAGTQLDGVSIPAASLTTSLAWYEYSFPALAGLLLPGCRYHLVFQRSGALNSSNYYRVGLDPLPVAGIYNYRYFSSGSWVTRSPASAAVYRLWGQSPTRSLAAYLCARERGGQFLTGMEPAQPTGQYAPLFVDRVQTYQRELLELLQAGAAPGRRLSAQVTPRRGLSLQAVPEGEVTGVLVGAQGQLLDERGKALPLSSARAGCWARQAAWPGALPIWLTRVVWDGEMLRMG